MNEAERRAALAVEADRIKDRLDNLNRYLSGHPDAWVDIVTRLPPDVAEVVIDKALSEARQQALAYATIVRTLAQLDAGNAGDPGKDSPADEIKRKREAKKAAAAALAIAGEPESML